MFNVKSGVRQAGVCSCWLLNLYINKLILKIEDCGFGCRLRSIFEGCISYADDILLVAGSLIKLELMLNVFFNFGYDNDLIFNARKSLRFAFDELFEVARRAVMSIGGSTLDLVGVCCYLGINICSGGKAFSITNRNHKLYFI